MYISKAMFSSLAGLNTGMTTVPGCGCVSGSSIHLYSTTAIPNDDLSEKEELPINKWYANRSVLITGATGFIGKVLIEKLLRSCPELSKIYLMIRFKKGKKPEERLVETLESPLFSNLKQHDPSVFDKIHPINGDLSLPNLNLSESDKTEIINNVSVIFHCGAKVKNHEQIKPLIITNTIGTRSLLRFSDHILQLDAFVFVSTIHAQGKNSTVIDESVKSSQIAGVKIAESILSFPEDSIEILSPEILGKNSNIYHYSKTLAEQILIQESNVFPACIVRCSIATATLSEPFAGWIDNLNGPTNIIIGTGKGILRSYLGYHNYTADFVPVDILVNCLITAAWQTGTNRSNEVCIYNCTSGRINRLTWGQFDKLIPLSTRKFPFEDIIWFPKSNLRQSSFMNNIYVHLFHTVPAYIFDLVSVGIGKSPRFVKNHSKYRGIIKEFEFYTTNQWDVDNTNLLKLQNLLSQNDKDAFNFDISRIKWPTYFDNYVKGIRKYVLKEDDSSITVSKTHLKKMFIVQQTFHITCAILFTIICTHPIIKSHLYRSTNSLIYWYRQYDIDKPISQLVTSADYHTIESPGFSLQIITPDDIPAPLIN